MVYGNSSAGQIFEKQHYECCTQRKITGPQFIGYIGGDRGRRGGSQEGAVTGQVRAGTGGKGSGDGVEGEDCQVGATGV